MGQAKNDGVPSCARRSELATLVAIPIVINAALAIFKSTPT
jgi:hypothetical protein